MDKDQIGKVGGMLGRQGSGMAIKLYPVLIVLYGLVLGFVCLFVV